MACCQPTPPTPLSRRQIHLVTLVCYEDVAGCIVNEYLSIPIFEITFTDFVYYYHTCMHSKQLRLVRTGRQSNSPRSNFVQETITIDKVHEPFPSKSILNDRKNMKQNSMTLSRIFQIGIISKNN